MSVVNLTVHKNTLAKRRARFMRRFALGAVKAACDDLEGVEAFHIVAMKRTGEYRVVTKLPEGTYPATWRGMIEEAAEQAIE